MNNDHANLILKQTRQLGSVYLGNAIAATDKKFINTNGITAVVNMFSNVNPYPRNIRYLGIEINDLPNQNIKQYFQLCYNFIDRCRKEGRNVLVHCAAGISRSTTILTYYISKKYNVNLDETLAFIKSRRSIINPNRGFKEQLKQVL